MTTILHTIETGGPGGAENFMIRMAESLEQSGFVNIILLLKSGWLEEQFRQRGFEVIVHSGDQGLFSLTSKIAQLVKEKDIDIVHSHEFLMNVCVGLSAPFIGAKCVTTVHGMNYYPDKFQRRLLYRITSATTNMVAVSKDIKNQLVSKIGVRERNVEFIANGINVDGYETNPETRKTYREKLGLNDDDLMLLAVGNLYPVKGHVYLIEAIKKLQSKFPYVKLYIAGRGESESSLKAKIEELGLQGSVHLLGFREDVSSLLMASDVFCLPSLSEGMPLAILEAMSAGKPVVASDVGGVSTTVINGKTGFLTQPGDADSICSSISRLLSKNSYIEEIGERAHAFVRDNYDMKTMLSKYIGLYGIS